MIAEKKLYRQADLGDYCKAFAYTAVISQPILASLLTTHTTHQSQLVIGLLYDLVKYTAPAFIFGILYSMMRTHDESTFNLPQYYRGTWSLLFVPSIWWTAIYLLFMPWVQQVQHWHNFSTFCWQFINGNAAPHLWYNSMMLQYIILVPLFWLISRWVGHNLAHCLILLTTVVILYFGYLAFYDYYVFHGPHMHDHFEWFVRRSIVWLLVIFAAILVWTNRELFGFGFPVSLYNATYYKPSMTLYCMVIITLIAALFFYDQRVRNFGRLSVMHFIATYAHRAFLSNIFWEQLFWHGLRMQQYAAAHPLWVLVATWGFTWVVSLNCAWLVHHGWLYLKKRLYQLQD